MSTIKSSLNATSLGDYLAGLAAKKATPGGGAVAAVTGAQAAALVAMVCQYSPKMADVEAIKQRANEHIATFMSLAEADVTAFNKVMAAYGLPADSIEKQEKLLSALQGAIDAPLAMMKLAASMIDDLILISADGNQQLITDSAIAAILTEATIKSAELNILINLKQISDESYTQTINNQLERASEQIHRLQQLKRIG